GESRGKHLPQGLVEFHVCLDGLNSFSTILAPNSAPQSATYRSGTPACAVGNGEATVGDGCDRGRSGPAAQQYRRSGTVDSEAFERPMGMPSIAWQAQFERMIKIILNDFISLMI